MTDKESYIQNLFADRLGGPMFGKDTKIYKFEKIKRAKKKAIAQNPGKELLDLGVGEPDDMAYSGVVKKMQEETAKPENRGYADNGISVLKWPRLNTLPQILASKILILKETSTTQ